MQLFTVDQANRTLPLVRRIIADVVSGHRCRSEKLLELELPTGSADGLHTDRPGIERQIHELTRDLDGCERELRALGIQLKDPRIGLIDFPANLDGRRVLLCWHLGEPSVQFWHDDNSGYAGRQPLAPTLVG
jgi:hypothetical protein